MSGGTFDYQQYRLQEIADEIEELIKHNEDIGYLTIGFDNVVQEKFSPEIIERFKKGLYYARLAYIYIHRIDYLVEGDDSEESFKEKLDKEIDDFVNNFTKRK